MASLSITINLRISPEVRKGDRVLSRQGKQLTLTFHDRADLEAFKEEFEARLSAEQRNQ